MIEKKSSYSLPTLKPGNKKIYTRHPASKTLLKYIPDEVAAYLGIKTNYLQNALYGHINTSADLSKKLMDLAAVLEAQEVNS